MYNCRKAIQEYEKLIRHSLSALFFVIVSSYRSLIKTIPFLRERVAYTGVLTSQK